MTRAYHPLFLAEVNVDREPLPTHPDQATAYTIARMAQYAREDSQSPLIQAAAYAASASSDPETIIEDTFRYVRSRVQFVRDSVLASAIFDDPEDAEVLIRPVDLVRMRFQSGDCDDFSMLTAALLLARGIPAHFVTVAADRLAPDRYSHVYVYAELPGARLVALDTSHGAYAGWEVANRYGKRRVWPIGGSMLALSGLGQDYDYGGEAVTYTGSGSGGGISPNVWQLINRGVDIIAGRVGAPPGTYIQTPGGVYSRGAAGGFPPGGFATSIQAPGLGMGAVFALGAAAVVAVIVFSSRR